LSRVLNVFAKKGLLSRKKSKADGRASVLLLTAKGEKEFQLIDQASATQLSQLLSSLSASNVKKLLGHMTEIKKLLTQR
jgi:DNA-binding MarR family transcriptional regulator